LVVIAALSLRGWRGDEASPPERREPLEESRPERPNGEGELVDLVRRPRPVTWLSATAYLDADGRLYSVCDIDGDGLFDADELRKYGTLDHGAADAGGARPIDVVTIANPADRDRDGLPDEWETGYLGGLSTSGRDDPDEDGFPNRVELQRGQSPATADLVAVIHRPKVLLSAKQTGGAFSLASREFWEKQSQVAAMKAAGDQEPSGRADFEWHGRPVDIRPAVIRTCPARHPWTAFVNRPVQPEEDIDDDGLPDAWEIKVFGDVSLGRFDDPDADGMPNVVELYRGTHPSEANVFPRELRPSRTVRLAPPRDKWDIGWDIRSRALWDAQEALERTTDLAATSHE
jgi:hypothetical protein